MLIRADEALNGKAIGALEMVTGPCCPIGRCWETVGSGVGARVIAGLSDTS